MLSDQANEKGPRLVDLMLAYLRNSQITLDPNKLNGAPVSRGTEPNLNTEQSLALLQDEALGIAKKYSLSLQQAAESAALATGFIVKECIPSIGGETGFNVAAYGFVEGTKTVPPRLSKSSHNLVNKPWYKFW